MDAQRGLRLSAALIRLQSEIAKSWRCTKPSGTAWRYRGSQVHGGVSYIAAQVLEIGWTLSPLLIESVWCRIIEITYVRITFLPTHGEEMAIEGAD
ncbi:hypothetical protein [Candidatus Reidiella endopervernicosa]|uniref:Uncharacterized protein n=1 Tax=Candidatus Reidiella endopervernicosa TaxID=2738883 RepID=A0A6N0HT59_9GAMM|nr:hypothetical protein [Candidatus Reidiella endopervernicosa]QKQ25544.1 hypothetical protein HUE57_03945 [Candidatus Reidiella endopervernicosa]